jgi:mRNA-degrading endonuclease RelE of RelBE toxin-antitoxin system
MEIYYTSRYKKDFRRLSKDIQSRIIEREDRFKVNPFDPRLRTHLLRGPLNLYHAFSINNTYRILFEFKED